MLALLVAISALALPRLVDRLVEARAQGASDAMRAAGESCRARAMASGVPMTFLAIAEGEELLLCAREYESPSEDGFGDGPGRSPPVEPVVVGAIAGMRLSRQPAQVPEGDGAGLDAASVNEGETPMEPNGAESGDDQGREEVAVAVFYPDGTARAREPVVLASESGRSWRATVAALTGLIGLEEVLTPVEELDRAIEGVGEPGGGP